MLSLTALHRTMSTLRRLSRLRAPEALLAPLCSFSNFNTVGATICSASANGERAFGSASEVTQPRSSAWSSASLLGAGAALLAASLLTPGSAEAKKELAILPGSNPPSTSGSKPAPQKAAAASASTPAAAQDASKGKKDAKGRPVYTREEVAKHRTPQDRVWVTFKDGVYDITDFVEMHPGGAFRQVQYRATCVGVQALEGVVRGESRRLGTVWGWEVTLAAGRGSSTDGCSTH